MNPTSLLLEQALKRMQVPERSIRQLLLASALSDPDGRGFPKELFQLSAPIVARGLLNFATLQMNRDWVYPLWIHRQLDPSSESFVARSQNPLLINTTHRNWTAVGTPSGFHEAIVDPTGLVTPLPREWSVDTWLIVDGAFCVPSFVATPSQNIAGHMPLLTTRYSFDGLELISDVFVGETRRGLDVLFSRTRVKNNSASHREVIICLAARPFGPEGVSPIESAEFASERILRVNGAPAIVFDEAPAWRGCSNYAGGDLANVLRKKGGLPDDGVSALSTTCDRGFGHAASLFPYSLGSGEEGSVRYSVALAEEGVLRRERPKLTWRVSFGDRLEEAEGRWKKALNDGSTFSFAPGKLRAIFEASRLLLLELSDREFISPGPYLYHRFWFRDAVMMVRALDALGFAERSRTILDDFPSQMTDAGFFRGPDGEWDSNGAVLWIVGEHLRLHGSTAWVRRWFDTIERAADWIARKRRSSANGLMPRSLSAEHLGTVDQYYWDSFWSLAGLHSASSIAEHLRNPRESDFKEEARELGNSLRKALREDEVRLGRRVVPSAPGRSFDESAIGSICGVYPQALPPPFDLSAGDTVREIVRRYVGERGFFHPIIHSGYNSYLTLQLAHALIWLGEAHEAWRVANTVFGHMCPPYSLPEAIHPKTGGGVMGDGHHGWAAAEIVLFIRDALITESHTHLVLFRDSIDFLFGTDSDVGLVDVPTSFGKVSCWLRYQGNGSAIVEVALERKPGRSPESIEIHLPFTATKISAGAPATVSEFRREDGRSVLRCSPNVEIVSLRY